MSIGLVIAGIVAVVVFYMMFGMRKYQYANDAGLKSMSEWLGILEKSDVKQRDQMSHSLVLFAGRILEQKGILPKNGLRNAIILNREVSRLNFIVLVCEEATNLDSLDVERRNRALDVTNARDYFAYCLMLVLAKGGPDAIAMFAFKSRYPIDGF